MDTDKLGRVRSYVDTQLPFVPFYGADLLDTVEYLPEAFGLQTPVLTARNPLVAIRPELHPPSASVFLEAHEPRDVPAQADSTLTKEPTEIQKKRLVKRPLGTEGNRPLRPKTYTQATPDPDSSSELAKEHAPMERERRGRREKPKLPTNLSFFYGFAPKNVGPSRLTMPAGGKGVFGKGKSSSTTVGISLPDLIGQPSFCDEPELAVAGPQFPSIPSSRGLDHGEFAFAGKERPANKFVEGTTEDVRSQSEQAEGIFGDCSTIWDIELEDGVLQSDSSSFAWGTTVVIGTERIWNHQEGIKQTRNMAVDSCDKPRSPATRSLDEFSRSSPRVTSRFFPKCVSGLREDIHEPRMSTPNWEGHLDNEPEVPTWDALGHHRCTDVGWDRSSNKEIDSFLGLTVAGKPGQEIVSDWGDMQSFDASPIEPTNSTGSGFPVSDPSLEVGYEVLSDWDTSDRVHYFCEGRRLLLGV